MFQSSVVRESASDSSNKPIIIPPHHHGASQAKDIVKITTESNKLAGELVYAKKVIFLGKSKAPRKCLFDLKLPVN